jgi:hypothetical protein
MPDQESERTGVLVIRAWIAPDRRELVARITAKRDLAEPDKTTQTAAGAEAATRITGEWLLEFEQADEP